MHLEVEIALLKATVILHTFEFFNGSIDGLRMRTYILRAYGSPYVSDRRLVMSFSVGDAPPGNKVVLVGNPGVGKSTIFQYFKTGRFVPTSQLNHHDKAEHTKEWMVEGVSRTVS